MKGEINDGDIIDEEEEDGYNSQRHSSLAVRNIPPVMGNYLMEDVR